MNKISAFKVLLFVSFIVLGCEGKKNGDQASDQSTQSNEWKEMDEFHMVMAETFHPYKDSADLAPAKAKAGELVAAADKWSNAPLPEKVNNDEMKTKLQGLKSETEVLADVVQNGEENAIGDQLTKVHDMFHEIQEIWYTGESGEHGHDHEHH
jgi:hypothetical protein